MHHSVTRGFERARRSTLNQIWPWKWYLSCLKNASGVPFIGFRLTFGAFLTSPQHGVASALRSCSQLAQTCLCQPWLRMRSTPWRSSDVVQIIGIDCHTSMDDNLGALITIPILWRAPQPHFRDSPILDHAAMQLINGQGQPLW